MIAVVDLFAAVLFVATWIFAKRNFRLTRITSSIWDFIVLIAGFGIVWSLASAFGIFAIADVAFFLILGLLIGVVLLSTQDSVELF